MKPENFPKRPAQLWEHFYQLTQIPRPSKQEQKVCQFIMDLADSMDMAHRQDAAGNLVVYVPGTRDKENDPTVIIQNHVDMVTVKTSDNPHDFETDPLTLMVDNGWLKADRTTLGADNGLGCAAALALMTDKNVEHGPLELLFTMDEETGLNGASDLDASLLTGSVMLNLDTEDWQELYVGCAGGKGWKFVTQVTRQPISDGVVGQRLLLRGLTGGHSGVQIHQQLGNANKLLGYWVKAAAELGVCVSTFQSGIAHNVISREGTVTYTVPAKNVAAVEALNERLINEWATWLPETDMTLTLSVESDDVTHVLSDDSQKLLANWLLTFPHGAQTYNFEQPADLVNLSINLALVRISGDRFECQASVRFFNADEAVNLVSSVLALADLFGMSYETILDYPSWKPDFISPLLAQAKALHTQLFDVKPQVKAIHAGLECGILKSKKPDMDILSFGPTIRGAHSPVERVEIATVEPFWQFLVALLRAL